MDSDIENKWKHNTLGKKVQLRRDYLIQLTGFL